MRRNDLESASNWQGWIASAAAHQFRQIDLGAPDVGPAENLKSKG